MKLTVDRIVEGVAVLEKEDMTRTEIEASLLPEGVREGSVLSFDGVNYTLDLSEEEARRKRILEKQRMLFKKSKKD